MTLRHKLILAQVPLAVALVGVGALSAVVTTRLGERSRLILADNYRSVLAAQRMKDALDRVNAGAMIRLVRARVPAGSGAMGEQRARFESELHVQEGNITEPHETDLTHRLRVAWNDYQGAVAGLVAAPSGDAALATYLSTVQPAFERISGLAEEILVLNQDAMVRKSDHAVASARRFEGTVIVAVFLALLLGALASISLTTRILRPLRAMNSAVRRFAEGDLRARAVVEGTDELGLLAVEFNRLAEKLTRYRASTLQELIQGQQAAQAAIDGLPDPVLLLDGEGRVHGANTAATQLLGIDPDRPPAEVFARTDAEVTAVVDRLRAHVLAGKGVYVPRGFEDAVRVGATPEGERVFLPRATPLHDETGAVSGAALVLQDATKLFRFDELKNNLVATVAHEFRTPLTSLRMALHLCLEGVAGPLTAKQADLLSAGREDCERLRLIVDDLLNVSRIESGHVELRRRRLDPDALVDLALQVHRATAEQAQVALIREVPPGLPEVMVDPERIELVMTNLLSNAIRYSPPASQIVVRARAADADEAEPRSPHQTTDPATVRFEISDAGPGIAAEHQGDLFKKFFRVPGSPQGGSGLGLFIARGLVQAHGGRIGVDSEPGRGATFWFTVPVAGPGRAAGGA